MLQDGRSHGTDQREFYQLLTYKDDVDLNAKLAEWEAFYNYHRPQRSLVVFAFFSEWISGPGMLNGYPVIPGELMKNPVAAKPPDTAVLFATEWTGWSVLHAMVVDVSHARLHAQRKPDATLLITSEYRA